MLRRSQERKAGLVRGGGVSFGCALSDGGGGKRRRGRW